MICAVYAAPSCIAWGTAWVRVRAPVRPDQGCQGILQRAINYIRRHGALEMANSSFTQVKDFLRMNVL